MDKLARLWLNRGRWEGRQLVSASWVDESTRPQVRTESTPEQYGYQWWVTTVDGHPAYAAMGSCGQLVEVVPHLGLVAVVASTDAVGAAGPAVYLDLVSSYIAPAIKPTSRRTCRISSTITGGHSRTFWQISHLPCSAARTLDVHPTGLGPGDGAGHAHDRRASLAEPTWGDPADVITCGDCAGASDRPNRGCWLTFQSVALCIADAG